jgi:ribose transport system ATP-binding protein
MSTQRGLASQTAFSAEGISRSFGSTAALRRVSLAVERGEIHALLGANGSGKSTLVKIIAGVLAADEGEIAVGGSTAPVRAWSVSRARAAGVHVVHQHGGVFPDLTVAENLAIGRGFEQTRYGRIRRRATRHHAQDVIDRFEIHAEPGQPLASMRAADRMMVAIARALQDQEIASDGLLILDEPTAAFPNSQAERLLAALRRYAELGQSILYITHRLDEVLSVANRVTVLRDGTVAARSEIADLDESALVELILGKRLAAASHQRHSSRGQQVLMSVDGLSGPGVDNASFTLRRGEILGIAGLLGSGRTELLRLLFGAARRTSGSITLDGREFNPATPRQAMRQGLALVPEDRPGEAALTGQSVVENLSAAHIARYFKGLRMRHRAERSDARQGVERYGIVTGSVDLPIAALSGGNQQKVILGRWLRMNPAVLLLDEPTQGVDAGSRAQIYGMIDAAVAEGAAAIVVASDFKELADVADRVIVMARGSITAELSGRTDAHTLTELAYGRQLADTEENT